MKKINLQFVIILLSAVSIFAQSEVVVFNDFEKGTQNWESRGPTSISSSKDQAASGVKSLRISSRREFWQGAQLNLTKFLKSGKAYKFTVSVRLAKNEKPDEIKMTMQGGDNNFYPIGAKSVSADEWTTISGNFKPLGKDPYLLVYIEAARANTSYFIDDFKIENPVDEIPAQSGEILKNDFEDLTGQNWTVRGDNVQMFSSNAGGSQNLKVSGRTQTWHGLALDVSQIFFKGRTYQISLSARLTKGMAKDDLKITMQQTPPKGEAKFIPISELKTVTDAEWVTISGSFTPSSNGDNLLIYVEAAGATTAFHIDNFVIRVQ
jgi:endo-1,4-beta-xylanase